MYGTKEFVKAGGLISYGPDMSDVYRRGAVYVDLPPKSRDGDWCPNVCSGSEVGLMQRRKFIAGLGVAAAWPIVAKAQERERIRRVSVLMNRVATDTEPQSWLAAFIHR